MQYLICYNINKYNIKMAYINFHKNLKRKLERVSAKIKIYNPSRWNLNTGNGKTFAILIIISLIISDFFNLVANLS